jgi:hypothetical protein
MSELPGWKGLRRADGVTVACAPVTATDGGERWIVVALGRFPIMFCPCCGAALASEREAKLTADKLYPMEGGND